MPRIPLAPEGTPQMIGCSVLSLVGLWVAGTWFWPLAPIAAAFWIWSIAFFRDPARSGTFAETELCSPADGTVQDITEYQQYDGIEGPAIRVGIFLSLFNVHVNRAPCAGVVRSTHYEPGKFLAAMNPKAADENESNTLLIDTVAPMPGPIIVRQIVGVAARRIICHATEGTKLETGERFGLIKFGSRTELIVPKCDGTEIVVSIGDKVRAGETLMARQPAKVKDHDRRREDVTGKTESPASSPA